MLEARPFAPAVLAESNPPVKLPKTKFPALLAIEKFMPMLRAAVRLTSATVTLSITCCSPGTRSRLMMLRPPCRIKLLTPGCAEHRRPIGPAIRLSSTEALFGGEHAASADGNVHVRDRAAAAPLPTCAALTTLTTLPALEIGRDHHDDLLGLEHVFGFASHDKLVAHQRQFDVAVGKVLVDLAGQGVIDSLQPLLGLGIGNHGAPGSSTPIRRSDCPDRRTKDSPR